MASFAIARAFFRVSPSVTSPGRAGHVATYPPSSAGSKSTVYWSCPGFVDRFVKSVYQRLPFPHDPPPRELSIFSDVSTISGIDGIVNLTIDGQIEPATPSCLCAHRCLPDLKGPGAQQSIMDRLHEVAAEMKEILGESVEREKPLSLSRRGKPTHVTFPLASRFVRHFRSVIRVDRIDRLNGRHDGPVCGTVAFEFVGYHPARLTALAFQ